MLPTPAELMLLPMRAATAALLPGGGRWEACCVEAEALRLPPPTLWVEDAPPELRHGCDAAGLLFEISLAGVVLAVLSRLATGMLSTAAKQASSHAGSSSSIPIPRRTHTSCGCDLQLLPARCAVLRENTPRSNPGGVETRLDRGVPSQNYPEAQPHCHGTTALRERSPGNPVPPLLGSQVPGEGWRE